MVVLITGGSRGIGRALVELCAARGDDVVYAARHVDASDARAVAADVTVAADVARVVQLAIARYGRIDALVCCAGVGQGAFAEVMAVNAGAVLACARSVLAVTPGARVVMVSSGIVAAPRADAAEYTASKYAVEGVMRALAAGTATGVVTAVQLGAHRTAMTGDDPALPPPRNAAVLLRWAMQAPAAEVHGRVIPAWERPLPPIDLDGADGLAHPLGPSPAARAALADWALHGALERYDGGAPLVKQLAAHHGVPLDAIVLGGGIAELADRALGVLVRPGEKLVANAPSWPQLPAITRARGILPVTLPYQLHGRRAAHDLDGMAAACVRDRGVRAVYLISPSNPMGAALDEEPFAQFLGALPPHVTVIVDEAYAEFITRADALRAPDHVRLGAPVIALRSFSKFYGLAALRIGYAIAPPPLAAQLAAAAPPFAVSAGAQLAAAAALVDRDHATRTRALAARCRAALTAAHADQLDSDAPFALVASPGVSGPRYFDGRYAMVPLWSTDATASETGR